MMSPTYLETEDATLADHARIRALYQQLMDGWNRGKAVYFASVFTEDADFIAFDGSYFSGREMIARWHQALLDTHLKGSRLIGEVVTLRFLDPDTAVVIARGATMLKAERNPRPERDSMQTLVAVRVGGEWKVAAFQSTRLRPIGKSLGGTLVWLLTDRLWRVLRPKR